MARIYLRIWKRGKRTWYADYSYLGRRYRKKVGPSKKLAELYLADAELQIARGELKLSKTAINLKEFLREYNDFSKVNHALASYIRYKNIIANFEQFRSGYSLIPCGSLRELKGA